MDDDRTHQRPQGIAENAMTAILPSRFEAFEQLTHAWAIGLIRQTVLTGESGAGKTWLWRSAAESARTQCDYVRWVSVPQLPGCSGLGLLQSLRFHLEDPTSEEIGTVEQTLIRVERRIIEMNQDGFRLEIVVEESHHLKREGFEVMRILQERLRSRGVQIGVLFVGQTPLLERFGRLSRLGRPVGWHLPHISMNEAIEILRWSRPDHAWTRAEADWIHRETLGNPRRIVRWSETWNPAEPSPVGPDSPIIKPGYGASRSNVEVQASSKSWSEPLLPVKPPLEESEGLIEVGYAGEWSESADPMFEDYQMGDRADFPGLDLDKYEHHQAESPSGPHVWKEPADTFSPLVRYAQNNALDNDEELEPL